MDNYSQGLMDGAAQVFKEMNETAYLLYARAMKAAQSAGEVSHDVGDMGQQYNGAAKMCVLVSMKMRKQESTSEALEEQIREFAAVNMKRYRMETGT